MPPTYGETPSALASPSVREMEPDTACDVDVNRPKSKAGRKPKAAGGTRYRPITSLTAEQRARKRAADRASQRASRQRTQEHIEKLKKRIGELVDDRVDNSEYQALQRRNLELEEELRSLKAVMEGRGADMELRPSEPIFSTSSVLPTPPASLPPTPLSEPAIIAQDIPIVGESTIPMRYHPRPPEVSPYQSPIPISSPEANFPSPDMISSPGSSIASPVVNRGQHLPLTHKVSKMRANTSRKLPMAPTSTPQSDYFYSRAFMKQPSIHIWEIPPSFQKAATPVEHILYGLVEHQRTLASTGVKGTELVGPRYPSLLALVAPDSSSSVHIIAKVISELLSRITYRTFVDKLAAFMVMYPVYQWLVMRSYETYRNMPTWSHPLLSQRTTPHPVWLSALGYPKLRDAIIANQEEYTTEEFQFLFVANLNVNWPHGIEAALTWNNGDVTVSKAFWDHTRNLSNYTIDEPFWARYPELRQYVQNRDRPIDPHNGGF